MLTHELVHALDQCTRVVDWEDERHLACAEIRAANLTRCSPLYASFRDFPPTIRRIKVIHLFHIVVFSPQKTWHPSYNLNCVHM